MPMFSCYMNCIGSVYVLRIGSDLTLAHNGIFYNALSSHAGVILAFPFLGSDWCAAYENSRATEIQ